MRRLFQILSCASALALSVLSLQSARAQVLVTIEQPGVQSSSVSGITTETFEGFSTGNHTTLNSSIGTYASPGIVVLSADQYGGAGGTGQYVSIGAQSGQLSATLALNGDADYFGFWYSAADAQNHLQLFENNTLVYTLDTPGLMNLINMQASPGSYYGNPNNGQDTAEPFVYVNFFGTNGTVFNKIVFSNDTTGTGFESDNHSIRQATATPEPGAWAMLIIGGASGLAFFRRKRAR